MEAKRLGLLRELAPGVTVIGALINPQLSAGHATGRRHRGRRARLRRKNRYRQGQH